MKATCSRLFWSPNWALIDLVVYLRGSLQPKLYLDFKRCFLCEKCFDKTSDKITTQTVKYGLHKDLLDCSFVFDGIESGLVASSTRCVSVVCFLSKIAVSNGLTRAGAFGSLTKALCWTVWISVPRVRFAPLQKENSSSPISARVLDYRLHLTYFPAVLSRIWTFGVNGKQSDWIGRLGVSGNKLPLWLHFLQLTKYF